MGEEIRILMVEDVVTDAELVERELRRAGLPFTSRLVMTEEAFLRDLVDFSPDLVLSDFTLPRFDGMTALRLTRERSPGVPVVIVTGSINEETAVECMKAGAADYVLKDHLARLGPAVEGALERKRLREERLRAEGELRRNALRLGQAQRIAHLGYWEWEIDADDVHWSEETFRIFGLTDFQPTYEGVLERVHPDDRPSVLKGLEASIQEGKPFNAQHRIIRPDGSVRVLHAQAEVTRDAGGRPMRFLGIVLDITERVRLEEDLRRKVQELAEADRQKDEFLAMLAHELRNPLAPIRNSVQVLQLVGAQEPNVKWAGEVIGRQVKHLSRLVDDLLDISRITRGKVTLAREPIEVAAIVSMAIEAIRPLIDERRHELEVSLPSEPLRVKGDLTRLTQVLSNLLNNAAKFMEPGGKVWLRAGRKGDEAVIEVKDAGVGIAGDVLPYVFDLFKQGDRSLDRSQGGLGIGLTLARRLVEMHGGTIVAASEGVGKGSRFEVRLPLLPDKPRGGRGGVERLEKKAVTPRRLLVVDDNRDAAAALTRLLEVMGHQVAIAHDGQKALEACEEFLPEVVFLDIGLPEMDGYEVARCIRGRLSGAAVVLVAVTGYGQDEDRRRSLEAGFTSHLVKPVDLMAIKDLLSSLDPRG